MNIEQWTHNAAAFSEHSVAAAEMNVEARKK